MKRPGDISVLIDRIPFAEGNVGEEAILASLLQDLEACGISHISVLSNQPERTRLRHGDKVSVIPDKPRRWPLLPFTVTNHDLLIWGGGHMLQDRSSQLYVPYVVKTLLLAKLLGVPRFIYAPGLGPVVNWFGRFLAKRALKGSQVSTVRDDGSVGLLSALGIERRFRRTADPAFSLQTPADDPQIKPKGEAPIIGFAPRRLFYRRGSMLPVSWQLAANKRGNSRFERFLEDAAAALDLLVEKRNARIRLIPMDIGPNPRDDLICLRLRSLMVHSEAAEVLDDDPPLEEFVRRLGELDLLVSSRLHGIILGFRFGLPFIGIDSDGKIIRLAGSIGCSDNIIKDADFKRDVFFNLAERTLDRGQELRQELLQRGALVRDRARENRRVLEQCLQSVAGGK